MSETQSENESPIQHPVKALEKIPLPWYVIVLVVVTIVAFSFGIANFPNSFKKSVELERAKNWVTAGRANEAILVLKKYSDSQPDNKDWKLWLLEAYVEAKKFKEAEEVLTWFLDRKVEKSEMERLDLAAHKVMEYEDSLEKPSGPKGEK